MLQEFGLEADYFSVDATASAMKLVAAADEDDGTPPRAPVVCIMGHVDHGKTTLLDALRKSNVADSEAGRITQSIGAFSVPVDESLKSAIPALTFLDTPGHAIFKNMRARGSSSLVSDIVVLVLSAADGVQQQTREAVQLAKDGNRPMVVAITKCDVTGVDPQRTRIELARELDIHTEQVGGDVPCVEVSALTGEGLPDLLESLALVAQTLNLKYIERPTFTDKEIKEVSKRIRASKKDPTAPAPFELADVTMAFASVVESHVGKGQGPLLNVVLRQGEIKIGDHIVCGSEVGVVRQLIDDKGNRIKSACALTSAPVQIMGMKSYEGLGVEVMVFPSEDVANTVVEINEMRSKANQLVEDSNKEIATVAGSFTRKKQRKMRDIGLEDDRPDRSTRRGDDDDVDDDDMDEFDEEGNRMRGGPTLEGRGNVEKMSKGARNMLMRRFEHSGRTANQVAMEREAKQAEQLEQFRKEQLKTVRFMVRADVAGSLEVVEGYFNTLLSSRHKDLVEVKLVRAELGDFTEADLDFAAMYGLHMIGFNVTASQRLMGLAKERKLVLQTHNVVFTLFDQVRDLVSHVMPHYARYNVFGTASVEKMIPISVSKHQLRRICSEMSPDPDRSIDFVGETVVCGSKISAGEVLRSGRWRVRRENKVIQEDIDCVSLRRFKDEVPKLAKGNECGIMLGNTTVVQAGDHIDSYEVVWEPIPFDDSLARGYGMSTWDEPPEYSGAPVKYLYEMTEEEMKKIATARLAKQAAAEKR